MKKTVSIILIFVLSLSLFSCRGIAYDRYSVAKAATKMNVTNADYRQEGYAEFISKLSAFSARLTATVLEGEENDENIAISPLSVYMALALAAECAEGETREEILSAVGVTYEELEAFTTYLYAFSNREFNYMNAFEQEKVSAFEELTNSIWADDGLTLRDAGVNKLANDYNCDLFRVNFGSGEAKRAISAYIKDKTHGLVDGDLELSPETIITLINTFYLKEVWNSDGDELEFTPDEYSFKEGDGEIERTRLLMGYYQGGKAYEGDGYSAFYARTGHGFDIKFILPNENKALSEVFTAENIYEVNSITDWGREDHENRLLHSTRVFFPEYEADFDDDIKGTLREMGIEKLFDRSEADLSGITDTPAYCSAVIHKCELEVNKKGIEGAAVTVIALDGTAGPPIDEYEKVYHDFIVDRAFGFVITDAYGAVLFSGVVNEI